MPKTIFGHPSGLFILFFTEMWERFSYYGMRALLILYMVQYLLQAGRADSLVLGFPLLRFGLETLFGPLPEQALASQIYGLYTGLVYLTPFFGGILADQILGKRKTVLLGAILMAAGHFLMASERFFLIALLLLIAGNGCFKPNISSQVGSLYAKGDPRRDGAFTLFYMGINVGAFLSPLVCGTLGQRYGWHYGFAAAGVGMMIALFVYLYGQRYLPYEVAHLPIGGTSSQITESTNRRPWGTAAGFLTLMLLNSLFWAVYEQQGNTLQLFADHDTERHLFGWEMPSTWFQSLNPAMIILLAPVLDRQSARLTAKGYTPSSVTKMAFGSTLLGASFLVLVTAMATIAPGEKISFLWLVLCTLIYTLGELYLSPVGLSLVSKIAPAKLASMLMGAWFLASFFGNYLSGYIGGFYGAMPRSTFFLLLASLGIGTGLAIFTLEPILKKIFRDV